MKHKKKVWIRVVLYSILFVILLIGSILGIAFAILASKTSQIDIEYQSIYQEEKYRKRVSVDSVSCITQEISCGYAVIEMFSTWQGGSITEESLYDSYGKVVTSTGKSFCSEFQKQFPMYETTMYTYLTPQELIDKSYECLLSGVPVPFAWAAKLEDTWTLHYSLLVGMDIRNDELTVCNPYGYIETITIEAFLNRTSFKVFEPMPVFYQMAFAFGMFEKNTIFIPSAIA